jgi:hypothetical protein
MVDRADVLKKGHGRWHGNTTRIVGNTTPNAGCNAASLMASLIGGAPDRRRWAVALTEIGQQTRAAAVVTACDITAATFEAPP